MNNCTTSVAVDGKGRAWVVTYSRQLKKEEQVQAQMSMSMSAGGQTVSSKAQGDTDLRTTDALKLEVFDPNGGLLGEIPLTHFADFVRVQGDFLFVIDSQRGASIYQYRIVDKWRRDAAGPRVRRKEGGDDGEDGNTSLNSPPSGDPEAREAVGKRQLGEKTTLSRAGDIIRFYNFDPIWRRGYFVGPERSPMERHDRQRG
jgi:hypothetical protein